METILEVIFELIIEGSVGALGDKKVPVPLRILAAVFLIAVYGGLVCFLFIAGILDRNPLLIGCGVLILAVTVFLVSRIIRRRK